MAPRSRGTVFARVLETRCPSEVRGRRESRALDAPVEIPVCRSTRVMATGTAETSRLSPREWFGGLYALSPVSGLYCHRYGTRTGRADRRQGRGARTTRLRRPPQRFRPVKKHLTPQRPIASPAQRYRDDRETSLRWAWDGIANNVNQNSGKANFF